MDRQTPGIELMEAVESTWEEYTQLAQEYGDFLRCAFRAPRGSSRMLAALHSANELGPHLSMVLRRYLDAVEILAAFYPLPIGVTAPKAATRGNGASPVAN